MGVMANPEMVSKKASNIACRAVPTESLIPSQHSALRWHSQPHNGSQNCIIPLQSDPYSLTVAAAYT